LKRKQLRSAAFRTVSRVIRRRPKIADTIHTPHGQSLLLQNALDQCTKDAVADLLDASSHISAPGREKKQKIEKWWRDRLKKVRQEVDVSTMQVRYLLFEDCIKEAREQHPRAKEKEFRKVAVERWACCYSLDIYDIEGRSVTKAEALCEWQIDGWTIAACLKHFAWYEQHRKTGDSKRDARSVSPGLVVFRAKVISEKKKRT
jgi:hypothetical protein